MALQRSLSRSCNAGPRITKIRRTPCMPLLSSLPLDPKLTLEQARGSSLRARQTEIRHNRVPTSPCRWDQLTGRSMGLPRAGRRPAARPADTATCDLRPVAPFIVRTSDYLQAVPRATRNNKSDKYVTCEVLPAQRQRLVP